MGYDSDFLSRIFEKTGGHCVFCGKQLSWKNYSISNGRGGWEVDHSLPVSKGGTDHLNNLIPACIPCNRSKGTLTTRQYRRTIENSSTRRKENPLSTLLVFGGLLLIASLIGSSKK